MGASDQWSKIDFVQTARLRIRTAGCKTNEARRQSFPANWHLQILNERKLQHVRADSALQERRFETVMVLFISRRRAAN